MKTNTIQPTYIDQPFTMVRASTSKSGKPLLSASISLFRVRIKTIAKLVYKPEKIVPVNTAFILRLNMNTTQSLFVVKLRPFVLDNFAGWGKFCKYKIIQSYLWHRLNKKYQRKPFWTLNRATGLFLYLLLSTCYPSLKAKVEQRNSIGSDESCPEKVLLSNGYSSGNKAFN